MASTVLITGSRGMLGAALLRAKPALVEAIAWDRNDCDLTNREQALANIAPLKAQWIINCAAYNSVDECESNPDQAFAVNADLVSYLCEAAERIGARLFHISTDYVFDGSRKEGYTEDDQPNPQSVYGQSKRAGELHALSLPSSIVVRTSRLFGGSGSGKKSFVDIILERMSAQSPIEAIDEEESSPTRVDDLALSLWSLVMSDAVGGIYHRTNDGSCTWYEFAKEIARLKQWTGSIVPVPASRFHRAARRPAYSQLVSTKFPPLRAWQEALAHYLTFNFQLLTSNFQL